MPATLSLPRPPQAPATRVRSTRDRNRLLARIHQKFQTITEEITLGSLTLPFTRIANPNTVLDDACTEEDRREKQTGNRLQNPPHLPYWAELWESSRALAIALEKLHPQKPRDAHPGPPSLRVLDLGCGMGLAGATAAALGYDVTLADLEPPALLFASLNTFPHQTTARQLNWQTDRLHQQFDFILGADILYERAQWPYLNEFWLHHLAPNGSILLAEPHRPSGDLFIPWIREHDWALRQTTQLIIPKKSIRLFRLSRYQLPTSIFKK